MVALPGPDASFGEFLDCAYEVYSYVLDASNWPSPPLPPQPGCPALVTDTELLEDRTGLGFEEHMHRGYRGLGSSALLSACRRDHAEVALLLISKGVSVKRDANVGLQGVSGAPSGGGPLHWASLHGRLALVEALVDREADLDEMTTDGPPLHWALTRKEYPVAAFLLNRGADLCMHHLNRQGKSLGETVDKNWLEKLGLGHGAAAAATS